MKLPDFGDLNVVFLTKYGSQLFGTNTPESDMDLKGVFLPTADQILLGKIPETISFNTKSSAKNEKNTKDDVDCQLYSFDYFIDLACRGQTVALEMLWAMDYPPQMRMIMDEPMVLLPSNVLNMAKMWMDLVRLRHDFITKNMQAFTGYARSQAVRYSIKGDKLNTVKCVVQSLKNLIVSTGDKHDKIGNHFGKPGQNGLKFVYENDPNVIWITDPGNMEMMNVCKRSLQASVSLDYALGVMQGVVDTYGKRAQAAADHDGADFKALSHAVRISLELKDLYQNGNLSFPFDHERAETLKEMKRGEWTVAQIMEQVDGLIEVVEKLAAGSNYPEKVDRKPFDKMILEVYRDIVLEAYAD